MNPSLVQLGVKFCDGTHFIVALDKQRRVGAFERPAGRASNFLKASCIVGKQGELNAFRTQRHGVECKQVDALPGKIIQYGVGLIGLAAYRCVEVLNLPNCCSHPEPPQKKQVRLPKQEHQTSRSGHCSPACGPCSTLNSTCIHHPDKQKVLVFAVPRVEDGLALAHARMMPTPTEVPMSRVSDILAKKGSQVYTISADASVHEALTEMARHNTGALVVVSGSEVVGIFTERDHARRVALAELDLRLTPLHSVLTPQVVCVAREASVQEAMSLMTQQRIRHLPVVDDHGMCGVVSIGDLVKSLVEEQEVEIRYLTAYIRGELAL